jgi:hypothetical protein
VGEETPATYNGTHTGQVDPFRDSFYSTAPPGPRAGLANTQARPDGQTKILGTLSIVFAFVFAPVGAVLGHLPLSQIKAATQQGRNRALVGLTLSYVFILLQSSG